MKNEKIITHVELEISSDHIKEVLLEAISTRDHILLEDGCESFFLSTKKDNPNTIVIFAVYKSQQTYEWHLEQPYVKSFFGFINGKLIAEPRTNHLKGL